MLCALLPVCEASPARTDAVSAEDPSGAEQNIDQPPHSDTIPLVDNLPIPVAPRSPRLPVPKETGFDVNAALRQEGLFLALQQGVRFGQEKTRRELGGPFFRDWFHAVRGLHGWKDGGRQFTNYVAHPMYGALSGFIQVQNDSSGKLQEFGLSADYWKSKLKALVWTASVSAQFELGPISQASLGNVGGGMYEARKMGYVDLVITPSLGTVWMVIEDALDRHLLSRLEASTDNRNARRTFRVVLNPMRSAANLLRFKMLWHSDRRPLDH